MELRDSFFKQQQLELGVFFDGVDKSFFGKEESFNFLDDKKVVEIKEKNKYLKIKIYKKVQGGLFDVVEKFLKKDQSDEFFEDDKKQSKKGIGEKEKKIIDLKKKVIKME